KRSVALVAAYRRRAREQERRLSDECQRLRQQTDQMRAAFEAVERVAGEHLAERNRLEQLVGERDAALSAQAAKHQQAQQAARQALAEVQATLQRTIDDSAAEIT